jgi:hypothetical protein
MDESRQMNSNVRELWSLAKDTERRVEGLHSDMRKVSLSRLLFILIVLTLEVVRSCIVLFLCAYNLFEFVI